MSRADWDLDDPTDDPGSELVPGDERPDGEDPEADDALVAELHFRRQVSEETHRLRVREQARRELRQERAVEPPEVVRLNGFLAVHDEPTRYRIDRLWPSGGRVVLAAQRKAGKTTAVGNLLRSLADGTAFLGQFNVSPPQGTVVLIDLELDPAMLRAWLRKQRINHTERVVVIPARGKAAALDILDDDTRTAWARQLRDLDAAVLVLDCLRPALDALGLEETRDAGRFLVAFDALLDQAGIREGVVVHHMGHTGERSRGDSRIRDWPDVEWRLVREKGDDDQDDSAARRYFAAYGRDVDIPEGLLDFDEHTRRLTLAGGSRRDTEGDAFIPDVLSWLDEHPASTGRAIEQAMADAEIGSQKKIRAALSRALKSGLVDRVPGPNRSYLHTLSDNGSVSVRQGASVVRQRTVSECVGASIEDAPHSQDPAETPVRHDAPTGTCPSCHWPLDSQAHHDTCPGAAA